MTHWLACRLEILKLTLHRPILLAVFGLLQIGQFILILVPTAKLSGPLSAISTLIPWYGWIIGWLISLWTASIEYSVQRKREFDKTSLNFFKAFLDFLIHQGNALFNDAGEKDFYSKLNDWQHQVIQGIAIGLGPQESEKYFQKMDYQTPLPKAYRESQDSSSSDPLCKWLQENLTELNQIRLELTETADFKEEHLERVKNTKQLGEFKG